MGLVERIKSLIKANLSDLLERSEDPEQVLTQLIADMQEDLNDARLEVAAAARDERRLYEEHRENLLQAERMGRKAVLAVKKGDDDLAREALRRKRSCERLAEGLKQQWETQRESVEALRVHLEGLELKIDEARRRKDLIVARRRLAQAQRGIQATASAMASESEAGATFERLADRVSDMELEAQAAAEVASSFLEDRFESLAENGRRADEELEQELARIKRDVAQKNGPDAAT
jgi:phage shock protein A